MSDKKTAATVTNCIAILSGFKQKDVNPGDTLEGKLGMDSLDVIELVMALEEEFEIEIADHEAEQCATVADVVALVERLSGVVA